MYIIIVKYQLVRKDDLCVLKQEALESNTMLSLLNKVISSVIMADHLRFHNTKDGSLNTINTHY